MIRLICIKLFLNALVFFASTTNGFAQNAVLYYAADFESATAGVGELDGYDGWLTTDALASGVIEEGIPGQGKAAYLGFLISEGRTTASAVRFFESDYPDSGRPIYSVDLDFGVVDSTNGERDLFVIQVANEDGSSLAALAFDNESKTILSRSAAASGFVTTGFTFTNGVPGRLEIRLDLAADTWSAIVGPTTLVNNAPLVGTSGESSIPRRLDLIWGLRDSNAPGDNYIIVDAIELSADSGPYVYIQNQPESQGVLPGETALLSVTATGAATLGYQWYAGRSGDTSSPLTGATDASYVTPPVLQAAEFWVRVSNGLGHMDSATALITPRNNPPITIDTVEIGAPGNGPASANGRGGVDYIYHIGRYPVTNEEYAAFLNAVAASDPHGLYDVRMGTDIHGGISRSGSPGSYAYAIRTADSGFNSGQSMATHPVNYVSFWAAARFANWLTSGDSETGVYDLGGLTSPAPADVARDQALFLNGGVAIANENEWYKAAFYDPVLSAQSSSGASVYWDHANQSNVSPAGLPLASQKALNYGNAVGTVTPVGAYGANSASAFGTYEQNGNVYEWLDDVFAADRRARGGAFDESTASKNTFAAAPPADAYANGGFRIVSGQPVIRRAVLTVDQSGTGDGTIFLNGELLADMPSATILPVDTQITLTAVPAVDSTFGGWSGEVADSVQSTTFTLTADSSIFAQFDRMSGPPIVEQPPSRTVLSGADVTLAVNALGAGLTYQWYLGESGDLSQPVSGATGASLELQNLESTVRYWVRVTASGGASTDSQTAVLTVADQVGLNNWSAMNSGTSNALLGVAWGSGRFVAVGSAGTILSSSDGRSWNPRTSGTPQNLRGVTWNGSVFVAVGWGGTILTSADGLSWLPRTSGTGVILYDVTYGSNGFVAVGAGGTILTSPDGAVWTAQTSPRTGTIQSVSWNGQSYIAVGATYFQGGQFGGPRTIYMSSGDGLTWTPQNAPLESYSTVVGRSPDETLLGGSLGRVWRSGPEIANPEAWQTASSAGIIGSLWTGERYIVVGTGGTIMSSIDGARWTTHRIDGSALPTFYDLAKNDEVIVTVGSSGQIQLSVIPPAPEPVITENPADQTLAVGASALLSVSATGQALSYQWYAGIPGDTTNPVLGGTSPTLSTLPVTEETSYWVRVSDAAGLYADSSASRLIPIGGERDFSWRWLHPLPGAVAWQDVIHSTDGYVAVGANGRIMIKPASGNEPWQILEVFVPQTLNAIAWNGSQYVSVGDAGTVLTSADGIYWQKRFSQTTRNLRAVTWDGAQFAAVGDLGVTLTSSDGVEWSRHDISGASTLLSIAGDGQQLVAVGSLSRVYTSSDGSTWTLRSSGTNQTLNDVIWDGTGFITCGNGGTILTSPDAINWTSRNSGTIHLLQRIRKDTTGYLAVGNNQTVVESADGVTWSLLSEESGNTRYTGIAFGSGSAVIVGSSGALFERSSGGAWVATSEQVSAIIRDVAAAQGKIIAVDSSGVIRAAYGIDEAWEVVFTATGNNNINSLGHSPNGFVAVGSGGWIARSADGEIWQEITPPTSAELRHVAWTGSHYLAVGNGGVILSSPDGIAWTTQNSGVTNVLNASQSFGGTHVVVGQNGTLLSSADLENWQLVAIPPAAASFNLQGGVHSGSGFLVFGNQSVGGGFNFRTLRSQDGVTWDLGLSFTTSDPLQAIEWNGERFMAVGSAGVVWTSENGNTWTQRQSADQTLFGVAWADGHWVVGGSIGSILAAADNVPSMRPEILIEPVSLRADLEDSVDLEVEASGTGLRYRWFRGLPGDVSAPVIGALSARLSVAVEAVPVDYWVRVSNGFGAWVDSAVATVSVLPDIPSFEEWAAAAGLDGADAEAEAAPMGDGVANLLKYAFNLNADAADGRRLIPGAAALAGLPGYAVDVASATELQMTLEFIRRRDSGLIYTPILSDNLVNWDPITDSGTVETIDAEWERVTVVLVFDQSEAPRKFIAVTVELPPEP